MKQFFTFFAVMMMALAMPKVASAYDYSAVSPSGHTLYYNVSNGEATVVYPGNAVTSPYTRWPVAQPSGSLIIPDSITYNESQIPVVAIGEHTFWGCNGITSVIIPSTVSHIKMCAFMNISNLSSVSIGDGVDSIFSGAFAYCNGLSSITIPSSVQYVDGGYQINCVKYSKKK